jgi:hypothetical protein
MRAQFSVEMIFPLREEWAERAVEKENTISLGGSLFI